MKESILTLVIALENQIQDLNDQHTNPALSAEEVARINGELEEAQRALTHYRAALKYEEQMRMGDREARDR